MGLKDILDSKQDEQRKKAAEGAGAKFIPKDNPGPRGGPIHAPEGSTHSGGDVKDSPQGGVATGAYVATATATPSEAEALSIAGKLPSSVAHVALPITIPAPDIPNVAGGVAAPFVAPPIHTLVNPSSSTTTLNPGQVQTGMGSSVEQQQAFIESYQKLQEVAEPEVDHDRAGKAIAVFKAGTLTNLARKNGSLFPAVNGFFYPEEKEDVEYLERMEKRGYVSRVSGGSSKQEKE